MTSAPSIFLYCHNVFGLGHIVRSIRIATALKARQPQADVRIVTGCRALDRLAWPQGVGLVELPPIPGGDLSSPAAAALLGRRHRILHDFFQAEHPDILLTDLLPTGLNGELRGALKSARDRNWPTRFVLGLPYAYVSGPVVRPANSRSTSSLSYYDAVVAYTDPAVHPVLDELPQDELPKARFYAGYVAQPAPQQDPQPPSRPPTVVVLNGGGGRSTRFKLVDEILVPLAAAGRIRLRIVLGALHDGNIALGMAPGPNLEIVHAMPAEQAADGASLILSACGYGTAFSLLRLPQPILFLPETTPLGEQDRRAEMLARLDRVWAVRNEAGALRAALEQALAAPQAVRPLPFSLDGAAATARWLLETISPMAGPLRAAPQAAAPIG